MIFDDDLSIRNNIHCYYLIALGCLGLRQYSDAEKYFKKVLDLEPAHLGAVIHKSMLDKVMSGLQISRPDRIARCI